MWQSFKATSGLANNTGSRFVAVLSHERTAQCNKDTATLESILKRASHQNPWLSLLITIWKTSVEYTVYIYILKQDWKVQTFILDDCNFPQVKLTNLLKLDHQVNDQPSQLLRVQAAFGKGENCLGFVVSLTPNTCHVFDQQKIVLSDQCLRHIAVCVGVFLLATGIILKIIPRESYIYFFSLLFPALLSPDRATEVETPAHC